MHPNHRKFLPENYSWESNNVNINIKGRHHRRKLTPPKPAHIKKNKTKTNTNNDKPLKGEEQQTKPREKGE